MSNPKTGKGAALSLELRGGRSRATLVALMPLPGVHNHFHGADRAHWRTGVPTYARVRYHSIYPGVDLDFYGDQGRLEYDFIISPFADPGKIRIRWRGADTVQLTPDGDMILETAAGQVRQKKLRIYQEIEGRRVPVAGSFVWKKRNELGLELGAYDRSSPLIVDPLIYTLQLPFQSAYSAVDPAGGVYLVGATNGVIPTTPGAIQRSYAGGSCPNPLPPLIPYPCSDVFVMKLNPAGTQVIYTTYLGGTSDDFPTGIGVDQSGNAFISGGTSSTDFPTTPGAAFPHADPTTGHFLAKLSADGSALEYSTYLPTSTAGARGIECILSCISSNGVAIDSRGNAYVTDGTSIYKVNAAGSALAYKTYVPAGVIFGIAVDGTGSAYAVGETNALDFPTTPGAAQLNFRGGLSDGFVVKLNPAGTSLVYATLLGGSSIDRVFAIKVDAQGYAYVIGATTSRDVAVTPGAFQLRADPPWLPQPGYSNGFVTKLDPSGSTIVYSTYFGAPYGIDVDANGNALVLGMAQAGFPVTPNATQTCFGGGASDLVLARLGSSGELLEATYLGGSGLELPSAALFAPDGSVYAAGLSASADGASNFLAKLTLSNPIGAAVSCRSIVVQNAASLQSGPVAPGEIVTIRGLIIGPAAGTSAKHALNGPVGTELSGVRVFFDNVPAPLLYVQAEQINAIAPFEIAKNATTKVHVEYGGTSTDTVEIPVSPAAPAIFHANDFSSKGAILNRDGTINSPSNPAKRGEAVAIFGTGGGQTDPPGITGAIVSGQLPKLILPVSVKIGGLDAPVLYRGAAPTLVSGYFQVNVRLPINLPSAGNFSVQILIGDITSPEVTIAVK